MTTHAWIEELRKPPMTRCQAVAKLQPHLDSLRELRRILDDREFGNAMKNGAYDPFGMIGQPEIVLAAKTAEVLEQRLGRVMEGAR